MSDSFIFLFFSFLNQDQCRSSEELNYFNELLYNGFWCFELITERDLSSGVCGICGIIGEVYLGDGNEKNCCSNSKVSFGVLFLFSYHHFCLK